MSVKIVRNTLEKIQSSLRKEQSVSQGLLIGYQNNELVVITECLNPEKIASKSKDVEAAANYFFPYGFAIAGVFLTDKDVKEHAVALKDGYIVLEISENGAGTKCTRYFESKTSEEVNFDIIDIREALVVLQENYFVFYLRESMEIMLNTRGRSLSNEFENSMMSQAEKLDSENVFFYIDARHSLISSSEEDETISSFLSEDSKSKSKKHDPKPSSIRDLLSADYIIKISVLEDITSDEDDIYAPVVSWIPDVAKLVIGIPLNIVAFIPKSSKLIEVDRILKNAIVRQSECIKFFMTKFWLKDPENGKIPLPKILHFCPINTCTPISVCYPDNKDDSDLEEFRKSFMHEVFMKPPIRPLYTGLNAINLEESGLKVLTNTHVGLKDPNIPQGEVSLVPGTYGYHHYMQERFDDNGWGCAYRSCQTIVSWFRFQGYTDLAVPSHREIQTALVDVGDKQKNFIGSKLWIGSIEINNVLNHLLGVTSKIMFVSKGSDLAMKGRELANHFKEQGTPIMIGGGVLAHTILGVCFSEITGDTRFLILDPHYTGEEDLKVIQNKGWCGWKGPDFWNQTAYYNLCLPQRPITC